MSGLGLRTVARLVASCVALVGLAFAQAPGFVTPDTKTDLAVAPAVFLGRAAHLWDAIAAGGQLQNQAYGYFWPMGPFFWLGSVLHIQPWAVQRAWLALVLCVAFLGAALLARALGVRSDVAIILGGVAYALSPRMLTVMGAISIEAWPGALAPWVLLPLVIGSTRGSPRRAAALSAVAVAMVGGVNAAATFSVIPLGAIWLLTRTPGPRRRRMMLWWPVFTLIGTLWWLVPLFVLGAYSPPFLDFIESAANTTFSTTLFDTLRGTSDWVPYVDVSAKAGNDLIRLFHLPVLSGVVLLLGVAGLLHRRNEHRQFLALGLAVGMLMVTAGHTGVVQGWGAGEVQSLLDGVLAPLRNVHKFDPIIRLPLVIGLAWTVDQAWRSLRSRQEETLDREERARRLRLRVLVGTAVIAVLGASMPAYTGRITPNGFFSIPDYWQQTADWLESRSDTGQALLVPGSSFGVYAWGNPRDEPMQFLAQSRWAVRNAVPLTPPGNIRMLDAVERRFAQGLGSDGLAPHLRRAGINYLVVRNDLAKLSDNPDSVLVHQALRDSSGLARVMSFGPDVGGKAHLDTKRQRVLINNGWQSEYPAVEIFEVEGAAPFASETRAPTRVVGGPEDLLDLADLGALGDEPTVLANDAAAERTGGKVVLTDGQRSVERSFGRVHDGASETRTPGQARRLGNPTRDYLLRNPARWSTTAYVEGAASVTASSSMSDASAVGVNQPGQLPYAAIDGREETRWRANFRPDQRAWWRVDLDEAQPVSRVRITAGPSRREVVRVRTEHQRSEVVAVEPGTTRTVQMGDGATDFVRVDDVSGRPGNQMSLSEVEIPGVHVRRGLRLPRLPETWGSPDAVVLRATTDARRGCAVVEDDVRCVHDRDVAGEDEYEFQRRFDLPSSRTYEARIDAAVRPGSALANAVFAQQPVDVTASSTDTPDARASVLAAVDGDPRTTWTADLSDDEPLLILNWVDRRTVSGIALTVADDTAARAPTELQLTWPGGKRTVKLDRNGVARFAPFKTRDMTIRVLDTESASSLGFDSAPSAVPVGITELRVAGVPYLPVAVPTAETTFPCGSGPTVVVNGQTRQTSVRTSFEALESGGRVEATLCGSPELALDAGTNDIDVLGSDLFVPRSLVLSDDTGPGSVSPVASSDPTNPVRRALRPTRAGDLLVLRENSNPGWTATQDGHALQPQVVDGWQQGWWTTPSGGATTTHFEPDALYRVAVFGGLVLLGLFVGLTVLLRRRPSVELEPLGARVLGPVTTTCLALLFSGLVAGWAGLAVGAVSLAVATVLFRRLGDAVPWVVGGLVLAPAVAYGFLPWGGFDGWAGALAWPGYVVVALLALVLGLSSGERLPRFFRRMPGSSTKR